MYFCAFDIPLSDIITHFNSVLIAIRRRRHIVICYKGFIGCVCIYVCTDVYVSTYKECISLCIITSIANSHVSILSSCLLKDNFWFSRRGSQT